MSEAPGPAAVVPGRLGILGGTFDPVHVGHLAVAIAAREALGLERVLFVPARIPPHRSSAPGASAEDRAAMVALAIAGDHALGLSPLELDRDGPSFTVDTVEALATAERAAGRQPDLWFLLSAEAFDGFLDWQAPERILAAVRLAVLPRDGHGPPDVDAVLRAHSEAAGRIVALDGPHLGLSASEIRDRIARGLSVRYLVPDAVSAYIADHGLYRAGYSPDPATPSAPSAPSAWTLRTGGTASS
ncbi:MAG: nicotinate (nicotinamide) nucleotide adenylyltransferase [Chloroflexi bacterium]|nr:nicotinate (nicotinamide) nucleotide adenylyltransferase [Chloroflexota bacterium]